LGQENDPKNYKFWSVLWSCGQSSRSTTVATYKSDISLSIA
jgi:hypothetical protein